MSSTTPPRPLSRSSPPSSRRAPSPPTFRDLFSLPFWLHWRIWKRAFLYTLPFALIIISIGYYYVNYYSLPVYTWPEALWWGDLPRCKYFVDYEHVDIEAPVDDKGRTPLHFSAFGNQTEVSKYLISLGANVNAHDNNGLTPLHYSTLKSNIFLTDFLISHGAQVDQRDENGRTPLHFSAMVGDVNTAAILIYNGDANLWDKDKGGVIPLEYARNLHGGAKSDIAMQIAGGREKAEETLYIKHLPRREHSTNSEDDEYIIEETEVYDGGVPVMERKRIRKSESLRLKQMERESDSMMSDNPEVRARERVQNAFDVHDNEFYDYSHQQQHEFDDDEIPIVRPLKKTKKGTNEGKNVEM